MLQKGSERFTHFPTQSCKQLSCSTAKTPSDPSNTKAYVTLHIRHRCLHKRARWAVAPPAFQKFRGVSQGVVKGSFGKILWVRIVPENRVPFLSAWGPSLSE